MVRCSSCPSPSRFPSTLSALPYLFQSTHILHFATPWCLSYVSSDTQLIFPYPIDWWLSYLSGNRSSYLQFAFSASTKPGSLCPHLPAPTTLVALIKVVPTIFCDYVPSRFNHSPFDIYGIPFAPHSPERTSRTSRPARPSTSPSYLPAPYQAMLTEDCGRVEQGKPPATRRHRH